jgi:phospholipase C
MVFRGRRIHPALAVLAGTVSVASAPSPSAWAAAHPSASQCQTLRHQEQRETRAAERRESRREQARENRLSAECKRIPEPSQGPQGIHKIKHVVIIMQENHSFDNYFGTYPGANGIPGLAGHPGKVPCVPDPAAGSCQKPYHLTSLTPIGGPHLNQDAVADVDHGKMDGFIASVENSSSFDTDKASCLASGMQPKCVDVMGYVDQREIPHYWNYAKNFVLQDRMFEPVISWSLPSHTYMVSGWMAQCTNGADPSTCHQNNLNFPDADGALGQVNGETGAGPSLLLPTDADDQPNSPQTPDFGWTDITYLLYRHHVSWRYYLDQGTEPDCADGQMTCPAQAQAVSTPEIWNPLPDFQTVHQDNQLGNIVDGNQLYSDVFANHLPAVSWVIPSGDNSEHAPATIPNGQDHVTRVIDAIMRSPAWNSTAIFLAWDDWGGYYDHVAPPTADAAGYGIRVPGLVISAYAKRGHIDHQTLSFDAYLKFIEDDFLGGQRLDPKTDGRPDPRPVVRESLRILGDLRRDFDFKQKPRRPLLLPTRPAGTPNQPPGIAGTLATGLLQLGP